MIGRGGCAAGTESDLEELCDLGSCGASRGMPHDCTNIVAEQRVPESCGFLIGHPGCEQERDQKCLRIPLRYSGNGQP